MPFGSELLAPTSTDRRRPSPTIRVLRNLLPPFVVGLLALFSAYKLPYFFPPHFALSESYANGFNNKAAIGMLFCISVGATIWAAWKAMRTGFRPAFVDDRRRIPRPLLAGLGVVTAGWIGALSWLVLSSSSVSVEDFYFVPQLEKHVLYHRELYRQIEFAYGPLLFYFPVWVYHVLAPWHVSIDAAYYVALVIQHLIGLILLYYVLNALPLTRNSRIVMFCALSAFGLNQLLGPNYTLFRFVFPYFGLILVTRAKRFWVLAICCACASTIAFSISSEIGIAFATGSLIYAFLLSKTCKTAALIVLAFTIVPICVWMMIWGGPYLTSLSHFSHGYLNLIIRPSLITLLLLAAISWLCPTFIGPLLLAQDSRARLLTAMFAISLALLPAAFGYAEFLHEFANGLGFLLLATVAVSRSRTGRLVWLSALCLVGFMFLKWSLVVCNDRFAVGLARIDPAHKLAHALSRVSHTAGSGLGDAHPFEPISVGSIESIVGHEKYGIPLSLPRFEVLPLLRIENYVPSYFEGTINAWGPEAQEIKVAEMRSVPWLIAPLDRTLTPIIQGRLHTVVWNDLIQAEIRDHWSLVKVLPDGIGLYRQNRR